MKNIAVGRGPERLETGSRLRSEQLDHPLAGTGSLDGDHGQILALGQGDSEVARLLLHPRQIRLTGGRVDDGAIKAVVEKIRDQIVDHPAVVVEHAAIQRLAAGVELVDIVGQQPAQIIARALTLDIDHRHVRNIEHAGLATHRMMLVHLRTVMNRQRPAGELDHLAARSGMGVEQGGL